MMSTSGFPMIICDDRRRYRERVVVILLIDWIEKEEGRKRRNAKKSVSDTGIKQKSSWQVDREQRSLPEAYISLRNTQRT